MRDALYLNDRSEATQRFLNGARRFGERDDDPAVQIAGALETPQAIREHPVLRHELIVSGNRLTVIFQPLLPLRIV
jgi:hypothetical protein